MGTSTNGILAYGVDLADNIDWDELYTGSDECEACNNSEDGWESDRACCFDGPDEYVGHVLKAAGITGVGVTWHCSYDYPMFIVGTRRWSAYRGGPVEIPVDSLTVDPGESKKIIKALKVLGLYEDGMTPSWLLCSIWG